MIRSTPAKYSSYGMPRYWCTAIHPDVRPDAGRQRDVVGGRHPHLDREQHGRRQVARQLAHARARRRGGARPGCRTPSRRSAPAAGCRRPGRCGRRARARSPRRRDELGDARRHAREPPPDPAHRAEGEVLADPLVADVGQARLRRRRLIGARVALDLAAPPPRASSRARSGRRRRPARRSRRARRRAPRPVSRAWRRNAGTHCSVTSVTMPSAPSPTRATRSSSGRCRSSSTHDLAVAGDELHADDGRRQVAEAQPGAVGGRGDGPGDRLAVDVAEVGHRQAGPASTSLRRCRRMPAPTRDPPASTGRRRPPGRVRSRTSCTPSVAAAAVNECPPPIALTRRPLGGPRDDGGDLGRRARADRSAGDHAGCGPSCARHGRIVRRRRSVACVASGRSVGRMALGRSEELTDVAIVHGTCHHDCPDSCGWEVTVDDGVAVKLRGRADHPYSHGELCPKVNRFLDRVYSPDRVLHPLRRVGPKGEGRFEQITWDDALAEIADPPARRHRRARRRGDPAVQRRRQPEPAVDDGPRRPVLPPPRRQPARSGRSAARPSAPACG